MSEMTPCPHPSVCGVQQHRTDDARRECAIRGRNAGVENGGASAIPPVAAQLSAAHHGVVSALREMPPNVQITDITVEHADYGGGGRGNAAVYSAAGVAFTLDGKPHTLVAVMAPDEEGFALVRGTVPLGTDPWKGRASYEQDNAVVTTRALVDFVQDRDVLLHLDGDTGVFLGGDESEWDEELWEPSRPEVAALYRLSSEVLSLAETQDGNQLWSLKDQEYRPSNSEQRTPKATLDALREGGLTLDDGAVAPSRRAQLERDSSAKGAQSMRITGTGT